jgi:hypothetical protein
MTDCVDPSKLAATSGPLLDELTTLAVSGLAPMFHPESQMFCQRRVLTPVGLVNEGLSPRYTLMCLLGLARFESSGRPAPIDARLTLRGLLGDQQWNRGLGEFGLLLWLCGIASPESITEACGGQDLRDVLKRSREGRERLTMELAWLLAGLAHAKLSGQKVLPAYVDDVALESYQLLAKNQGPHGLFGHLSTDRGLRGMIRGHIGSFADQVYPIYSLARFSQAYGVAPALEKARSCAEAICRLQGPSGQWWWHYDARTGKVLERYPVYSVHQHGMAPMALFALTEVAGIDFTEPIYRGLRWVTDTNELGTNLADAERGMIWRCIYQSSSLRTALGKARCLLGIGGRTTRAGDLRVLFECWPYELGWLLYAFAGRPSSEGGASTIVPSRQGVVKL